MQISLVFSHRRNHRNSTIFVVWPVSRECLELRRRDKHKKDWGWLEGGRPAHLSPSSKPDQGTLSFSAQTGVLVGCGSFQPLTPVPRPGRVGRQSGQVSYLPKGPLPPPGRQATPSATVTSARRHSTLRLWIWIGESSAKNDDYRSTRSWPSPRGPPGPYPGRKVETLAMRLAPEAGIASILSSNIQSSAVQWN